MVSSVLRRVVAVSSMAMLGGFLAQPAEAFNLGELRAKLVAMENTTWRHIRDDLLRRLPAERNVTPPALPKSAFAA